VNSIQREQTLQAAQASARRLLVRAIDIRFNLDDTVESMAGEGHLNPVALRRLRADADALCREIDRLADAVWPLPDGATPEDDEVDEAAAAA
jgi:hypothetical protein